MEVYSLLYSSIWHSHFESIIFLTMLDLQAKINFLAQKIESKNDFSSFVKCFLSFV